MINIAPFEHEGISYEAGWKLAKINGRKATTFISELYPYLRRMRWDYTHQRYYAERFSRAINFSSDETLIHKPIDFELLLLALPSEGMKKHYPEDFAKWEPYRASFLDDFEYAVFASGDRQIKPDSNSLHFEGKIYMLLNEGIYSSAGAMAAIGMLADNIYTVGQNTGWLLGRGINPIVFELPHAKILYRIEPVIDFQNAKTAEDVYHDKVEIPVALTIDQYLKRTYHKGDIYDRAFLFKHDPVFIRACRE